MSKRPNIVYVFADQWRAQAAGYAGDPNVKTPNIDRLAGQSINFTHAVSSCPVCTPARASLMTGQYPHKHGLFINDVPLDTDAVTMGKLYKHAGYDTAYIGKWHINAGGRSQPIPLERRQGFDYWKVLECTHRYSESFYYEGDSTEKKKWDGYDAFAQTDDACNYLKNHDGEKPFLLVLSWGPPHDPYQDVPDEYKAMYDPKKLELRPNVPDDHEEKAREDLAGYYAHVTAMDDCVAKLIETLDKAGLSDDTIFILTSDHGDMLESQGEFNKQRPWDESLRIPLLLRWPAQFGTDGRETDCLISVPDHLPTLLGLCGMDIPDTVQGSDYSSFLHGKADDPSNGSAYYTCYVPFGLWRADMGGRACRGVRTKRYTYVRNIEDGPWLLYDNDEDPYQMKNLCGDPAYTEIQASLEATLQQWLEKLDDDCPKDVELIERWGYEVNEHLTAPYAN